uniref:RING-type domain-containing protein n=1 Tax=Steinernema glaseri TaxID=37863 RepID=A0A1I7YC51_9BILA
MKISELKKECERLRSTAALEQKTKKKQQGKYLNVLAEKLMLRNQLNEAQANEKKSERRCTEAAQGELIYKKKYQNLVAEKFKLKKQLKEAQEASQEKCERLRSTAAREQNGFVNFLDILKKQLQKAQANEEESERLRAEAAQRELNYQEKCQNLLAEKVKLQEQLSKTEANEKAAIDKESERLRAKAAQRELKYKEKYQNLVAEKVGLKKQLCEAQANEKAALETCLSAVEKSEKLENDNTCVVCMDAKRNTIFLECGHLVACEACVVEMNECCVCRRWILVKRKVFY